jgi:hypothetical protein
MGWVILLLFGFPTNADADAGAAELRLSGVVPPTLSAEVGPAEDGFSLKNAGNEIALFQIGSRNNSSRGSGRLAQGQEITLRTDFVEHGTSPVEIRIMAP